VHHVNYLTYQFSSFSIVYLELHRQLKRSSDCLNIIPGIDTIVFKTTKLIFVYEAHDVIGFLEIFKHNIVVDINCGFKTCVNLK
jgi:hypothetical protein